MGTETLVAIQTSAQDKEAETADDIAERFDRKARLLEMEYVARKVGREEARAELLNAKWEALLFLIGLLISAMRGDPSAFWNAKLRYFSKIFHTELNAVSLELGSALVEGLRQANGRRHNAQQFYREAGYVPDVANYLT